MKISLQLQFTTKILKKYNYNLQYCKSKNYSIEITFGSFRDKKFSKVFLSSSISFIRSTFLFYSPLTYFNYRRKIKNPRKVRPRIFQKNFCSESLPIYSTIKILQKIQYNLQYNRTILKLNLQFTIQR
jgi:hypothetical protein